MNVYKIVLNWHRQQGIRQMALVMLLIAGCERSVTPVAEMAPTASAPERPSAVESSAAAFLDQKNIVLPDRSQVIKSVDLIAGCGDAPLEGRMQLDGRDHDWLAQGSGIAGIARHDKGELVWTEYPFDDGGDGAFQYPGEGTAITPQEGTAGTASELMQRYGANAADVVEFRAAADNGYLYLMLRLNFLNAVDSTVIGLGFDLDHDAGTGTSAWPRGANIRSEGRGFDLFLTAHGDCAYLAASGTEQRLDAAGGAIRTGTRDNIMEIALPLNLLGGTQSFALVGGAGLWDAAPQTWMAVATGGSGANTTAMPRGKNTAGAPEVFNLLFRDDEASIEACAGLINPDTVCEGQSARTFQTRRQVGVLRAGTSGPYAAEVEIARLQPGAASDPLPLRRGAELFFTRVYRSRIDAEGILGVIGNAAIFTSRYQPYTLYVSACQESGCAQWPQARAPLLLQLHGGGNDHLSASPRPSIPEGGDALYGSEDFFAHFDHISAALIASPLGRGIQSPSWRGYGEADVLEVLDDVRRVYDSDRERQGLIGGSQGGYGTLRLAGIYPDLWNGVFVQCPVAHEASANNPQGHIAPETVPFVVDPLIPNLINLPFLMGSGTLDPLAPITMNQRLRDRAFAEGLSARYTEYLGGSHCFDVAEAAYPYTNAEAPAAARVLLLAREQAPAVLRYRVDPRHYAPGLSYTALADTRDLMPAPSGAYWVTGMAVRDSVVAQAMSGAAPAGLDESVLGQLDVVSHALEGAERGLVDCTPTISVGVAGVAGGNPESTPLTPTPNYYQCQQQQRSGAPQPQLELQARNLDAMSVDLVGAGLQGQNFVLSVLGDGPLLLTLSNAAVRNAHGEACVTAAEGQNNGEHFRLQLELSTTPCEVMIEQN